MQLDRLDRQPAKQSWAAAALSPVRGDHFLALGAELALVLGQTLDDAAAARLDALAEFLEIGLASRFFLRGLGQRRSLNHDSGEEEKAKRNSHLETPSKRDEGSS